MHLAKRIVRLYREPFARIGYASKPSFLILGAQKAGTTSLYMHLGAHPKIRLSRKKEVDFFSRDKRYARGTSWYHTFFPLPYEMPQGTVTFEASPTYLSSTNAPKRMRQYNPQLKLIALLRDPVERAFSAWNMYRQFGVEPSHQHYQHILSDYRSFDDAVKEVLRGDIDEKDKRRGYLSRGHYADQLTRYFAQFPREQILILEDKDLKRAPLETVNSVIQFIGLDPIATDRAKLERKNTNIGNYISGVSAETRAALAAYYQEPNQRLYDLLERDFEW